MGSNRKKLMELKIRYRFLSSALIILFNYPLSTILLNFSPMLQAGQVGCLAG